LIANKFSINKQTSHTGRKWDFPLRATGSHGNKALIKECKKFFKFRAQEGQGGKMKRIKPDIRNKIKRQTLYRDSKLEKSRAKHTSRKERDKEEIKHPKLKEVCVPNKPNLQRSHTQPELTCPGTTKTKCPQDTRKSP
jgi:hypothetical protein